MKNLVLFLFVLSSSIALSQGNSKNDIIVTKNGELIQAKVVKVTSDRISFNYPGETVINEVAKDQLEKIVFSSGRTQTFGEGAATSNSGVTIVTEDPQNKPIPKEEISLFPSVTSNSVAVVPATFTKNGSYSKELSSELSSFISGYLAQSTSGKGVTVQDMTQTIRNLVDNGIGYQELKNASTTSLRNALGTEFLVRVELEERQSGTVKKGFYGDEEPTTAAGTTAQITITVFGSESEAAVFSAQISQEVQGATNTPDGWRTLTTYVLDQFLASNTM